MTGQEIAERIETPEPAALVPTGRSNGPRAARIAAILRCPQCRGVLTMSDADVGCAPCQASYRHHGDCFDFAAAALPDTEDASFQQERMHHRSLRGRLYDLGQRVITSEYAPFDHRAAFLAQIEPGATVVELGSGNRRLNDGIINIDLFPFPNVDIAADIEKSPIASNSVDYVILDSVIEHVPNPQAVIDEVLRILKPRGKLFCINPFLFPYHGYPAHYCNFTRDGMQQLLRNFSSAVVEPHYGPTSAVINILSEYVAVSIAGQRRTPYLVIRASMLLVIGWLRFIDRWLIRSPQSYRLAGMICSVAVK
ncbi:class I SAM-dependent methyltransferase [Sandarakinorhabdus sp. DWP1-3-1]|uniref:class I SAM-dependent methyltransferase n=1 Tax=Sandarakinorhabdus sp. DWP1-3-1 TaxID=2804627 RepID=UPI003CF1DD52